MRKSFCCIIFFFSALNCANAAVMQGYGVKSCYEFLRTQELVKNDEMDAIVDDLRYRSWLSGFVSGINLATDDDVLRGVKVDSAMRRISIICTDKARYSFREASLSFLEQLKTLPMPSE